MWDRKYNIEYIENEYIFRGISWINFIYLVMRSLRLEYIRRDDIFWQRIMDSTLILVNNE